MIDVPAMSQVHRQVVRKDLDLDPIVVDPTFSLFYVEVAPAELGDAVSASGMLRNAVAEQHVRSLPDVDGRVLPDVHRALARADGAATVAVRHRDEVANQLGESHPDLIVAVWPGYVGAVHGVAVDIGSTTIAGHLCDLSTGEVLASAGRMNPQIRFGEDLMSRVSYVMMNPGGERELTTAVRTALDELIGELVDGAGVDREHVLEVVLVGNPIMHHIALGIDPTPLGSAPFVLATDEAVIGLARDLDLDLPAAAFYAGPCIAGHVGADTAAALLAEGPHRGDAMQLLVDVGTNAEIVLGDRTRQYAASSPTGPAFEGAQISCGQRAMAGAIERVRIDRESLEPAFKVIGSDVWSDDPGFEQAVASSGVTGVCGSGIIDVVAEMYLAGLIETDGTIRGEMATRTERIVSDGRTFSYVLYCRRRHPPVHHPERRAGDPARQGCAARRHRPARRARRFAGGHRHPPRRGIRRPHRSGPRDGARSRARLSGRRRAGGRQCRRRRRGAGPAVASAARRDGIRRASGHQDRDRDRTAVPRTVRRGDGTAARDEPVAEPGNCGRPALPGSPLRRGGGRRRRGSRAEPVPATGTAVDVPNDVQDGVMEDVS